jgi:hypothetical protein
MLEYLRIDASAVLSTAVLVTVALLTGSLIVRMLGSGSPFRIRLSGPALPQPFGPRGPTDIDLARLDDDGGWSQRTPPPPNTNRLRAPLPPPTPLPVDSVPLEPVEIPYGPVERFHTPMIPGAREPGVLTTFGVPPLVIPDSPTTMDAVTIASRQREGGGAPSERRPRRQGSTWQRLTQTLRHLLIGGDRT